MVSIVQFSGGGFLPVLASKWTNRICALFLLCALTKVGCVAQTFTILATFEPPNGLCPWQVSLVQGRDGNFYGTTEFGGTDLTCTEGCGTFFKMASDGTLETLHSFTWNEGAFPLAGVILGSDGDFYGTTSQGGLSGNGYGSVFKITSDGVLTTLHGFGASGDGAFADAPLIQGTDGSFYGTTENGGLYTYGTVFRVTPNGTITILHSFCATNNCPDGYYPSGGLVQVGAKVFYGTTLYGGDLSCRGGGCGTVFKITPQGVLTPVHTLTRTQGENPRSSLALEGDGELYGTTSGAGLHGGGTVFKIKRTGQFKIVHQFGGTDGAFPYGGIIQATDGSLYGTTLSGGDFSCGLYGCGTVFQINATGQLTTLHMFDLEEGIDPTGYLLQATDGKLYGTTFSAGGNGDGTAFQVDMHLSPFAAFVRPFGKVGQSRGILGQGFTGTTSVIFNGVPTAFKVKSDTYLVATVPPGATTGYVTVTTPTGPLTSNKKFVVLP